MKTWGVALLFVSIEWRIKYNCHEGWRLDSPRGQNHMFFSSDFCKAKYLPAKHAISVLLLKLSLFGCFQHLKPLVLWRIMASPSVPLRYMYNFVLCRCSSATPSRPARWCTLRMAGALCPQGRPSTSGTTWTSGRPHPQLCQSLYLAFHVQSVWKKLCTEKNVLNWLKIKHMTSNFQKL